MSKLLDDLIAQSRTDSRAYEAFLARAEDLVIGMARKESRSHPAFLNGHAAALVFYNNLAYLSGGNFHGSEDEEARVKLALDLDSAVRERAPADWRGDDIRETEVLNALFPLMARHRQATTDIFEIIKNQPGILMNETIQLGDISVIVTRKAVKNAHLSVHPPLGRVTLLAPTETRLDVARAYAISKLAWIREQQAEFTKPRETPRRLVERETHQLWGRHHLLRVTYKDEKSSIVLDHRHIRLTVRPDTDLVKRSAILHGWHQTAAPSRSATLEHMKARLNEQVTEYFLQRMKTK